MHLNFEFDYIIITLKKRDMNGIIRSLLTGPISHWQTNNREQSSEDVTGGTDECCEGVVTGDDDTRVICNRSGVSHYCGGTGTDSQLDEDSQGGQWRTVCGTGSLTTTQLYSNDH